VARIFSAPKVPGWLWGPPSLLFLGCSQPPPWT